MFHRLLALLAALVVAVGLTACSTSTAPPDPEPETGAVAGELTPTETAEPSGSGHGAPLATQPLTADPAPEIPVLDAEVLPTLGTDLDLRPRAVPGEVIVAYRRGDEAAPARRAAPTLEIDGVALRATRAVAAGETTSAWLYRSADLDEAATLHLAQRLALRPDVAYAQPNWYSYAAAVPDDTFYPAQWHYPAIRMPEAWDVTTGSAITVAVVDSGILYVDGRSDLQHPDFMGMVLPGYDFISDPRSGGDGDARDASAADPGSPNFHGSHVAGTIAAATNNTRGVAGVNWSASILPLRVLGVDGNGSTIDIMEGALWAAGGRIPGLPDNPNPAEVINMSLGGQRFCSPYEQAILDEIATLGAIVVVAAGNENDDANRYSPASCSGVITVGATDAVNDRARYSNYGPRIDVMAPGGDTQADRNGDGNVDGVLSLGYNLQTGDYGYNFLDGTSMASPHVAGVISLMKGLDPALTADRALQILRTTATPLNSASCKRTTGKDCGAGLIDAYSAILATTQSAPPPAAGGVLAFNPDPMEYGAQSSTVALEVTNTSAATVNYQLNRFVPSSTNPADIPEGVVTGENLSGTVGPGASVSVPLSIDRSLFTTTGSYAVEFIFEVGGGEQSVLARFNVGVESGLPSGETLVASFLLDDDDDLLLDANNDPVLGGGVLFDGFATEYEFEATAGRHFVLTWVDENDSDEVDSGDYIGFYPDTVEVGAGATTDGVDMGVGFVFELSGADRSDAARRVHELAPYLTR